MDETKLVETLKMIVKTLDQLEEELEANLGPQAVDTVKEPMAEAHKMLNELIDDL